jgi:hypothetical protein
MEDKKTYEAPRIQDHGDLTELTALTTTGTVLDADFSAGTPLEDVTTLSTP